MGLRFEERHTGTQEHMRQETSKLARPRTANVFKVPAFTHEINERFETCVKADESDRARGTDNSFEFLIKAWKRGIEAVATGEAPHHSLSCISISIARMVLAPAEQARAEASNYGRQDINQWAARCMMHAYPATRPLALATAMSAPSSRSCLPPPTFRTFRFLPSHP